MTKSEKKISAFCARHGLSYEWQALRFNGKRAVIASLDLKHHEKIMTLAKRLKGISVKNWWNSDGGVWEGYVYLQDASEAEQIHILTCAESTRKDNWWKAYHDCLVSGMDQDAAMRRAESLFPTPA